MKLVMIYGPPAVGKLTVAKELAEITDFNVLSHNQLLDVLMPTLELKLSNPKLWEVYEKIKLEIIKMATETNKNLIVTEVYNEKVSLPRIKSYLNSLNKLKVVPYFVRLTAKSEDLIKRVSNKDRLKYNKLKHRKQLKELARSRY